MKWLTLFLLNAVSAISFLPINLLIKLRLRREPDPWRRTVGTGLRSEASKFALSAFGVHLGSTFQGTERSEIEQDFVRRFTAFIRTEPCAQFALRHDRFCSYRVTSRSVDALLAEFSPWGELRLILPLFEESHPVGLSFSERCEIERLIVEEYNRTRQLPEFTRVRTLLRKIKKRWSTARKAGPVHSLGAAYSNRLMNSFCVSFEASDLVSSRRFEPPEFSIRRIIGTGFVNLVCRTAPGSTIDLWMQVHHTGGDGSPMQELLTRLEKAWGSEKSISFPTDRGFPLRILPCSAPEEERPLHLITDFVDFSPLIRLHRELKIRFGKSGMDAVPLSALFLWCLAGQPEFEDVKFANAVNVPANEHQERGVDLIPICPGDYRGESGFAAYLRDFQQLILDAQNRRTPSYFAMRNLAILPPPLASAVLRFNPEAGRSTFGTVGVSMVREAKVVVGTMADQGFDGGFILIGNMSLPCANGQTSGAVSIKGEYAAIREYPMVIRRAIQSGSSLAF